MRYRNIIYSCFLFIFSLNSSYSNGFIDIENDYNKVLGENKNLSSTLKIHKSGIKVFVFRHKGSLFSTFKAETTINSSIDSIIAVMLDNDACVEWLYSCYKSIPLKQVNFNEHYHYQILSIPFPFSNRGFIFRSFLTNKPFSKSSTITITTTPDYCTSKISKQCLLINNSKNVMVKKSIGIIKLEPGINGTKITWTQHTDPNGKLPAWLMNSYTKHIPFESFSNLKTIVQKPRYKDAKLKFDTEGNIVAFYKQNK